MLYRPSLITRLAATTFGLWLGSLPMSPPAAAHPHIWVAGMVSFIFEDGKLAALRQAWAFDDLFSATLIRQFDRDRNGAFDDAEQADIAAKAFAALRDYGYFTRLKQGPRRAVLKDPTNFSATLKDGLVLYGFTLAVAEPLDPAQGPLTAGIYDESYFVDVMMEETDPVRFEGVPSGACHYELREDPAEAIYSGFVIPQTVTVRCAGS